MATEPRIGLENTNTVPLTLEDWRENGKTIARWAHGFHWFVGDWLRSFRGEWGSMYDEAEQITGLANGTLRDDLMLATKFQLSRRRDNLSFMHHRAVAALPPHDADQLLELATSNEWTARELRAAIIPAPTPVETPGFPTGPFRAVVIDPPWPIEKIILDRRPAEKVAMDYPTWTLDRIRDELPVARLCDPRGAHVYLWVTHKFLPFGLECFAAWGVRYECVLTWIKNTAQPLWWTFNTEHVLFGKFGSLAPLVKGTPVGFNAKQQRHSHKPTEFFDIVVKVSPEPRITMFDGARDGFTAWGVTHA